MFSHFRNQTNYFRSMHLNGHFHGKYKKWTSKESKLTDDQTFFWSYISEFISRIISMVFHIQWILLIFTLQTNTFSENDIENCEESFDESLAIIELISHSFWDVVLYGIQKRIPNILQNRQFERNVEKVNRKASSFGKTNDIDLMNHQISHLSRQASLIHNSAECSLHWLMIIAKNELHKNCLWTTAHE